MSFLGKAVTGLVGGLIGGPLLGSIFGKKKKAAAPQAPVPTPTRNLAAEKAAQSDLLAKRRGVVANLVMGAGGAEASGGTGTKLGS